MSILQGTTIEMLTDADPERLKHERTTAMANLGREIADISKWYSVEVPAGTDIELLINKLNELSIVEIAVPVPLGAPPPSCTMSVNCQADQVYLGVQGPSEGINATAVWSQLGANGQGVRVTNIEETYGTHSDLPTITNLNGHPAGDTAKRNHGTNTFGILGSKHNSLGTRGIAYGATHYFASSVTTSTPICTQLAQSRNAMQPGDVILIEKQIWVDGNQTIRGPVEHHQPNYDCIVLTVGLGYSVVETAGNGSLDLDSPAAAAPHNPYHPLNHSGAIMVGAGTMGSHSALWYSNYGSRVDVQGWGEGVLTTNAIPTNSFVGNHGGTSAAGAIVAGVVALIQSAYKNATGKVASPSNILNALVLTGLAQTGSKHIGPLPNAYAAAQMLFTIPNVPTNFSVQSWYCYGQGQASWSPPSGTNLTYQVEGSYMSTFPPHQSWTAYMGPSTWTSLNIMQDSYFRVRAWRGAMSSEYSGYQFLQRLYYCY